MLLKPIGEQLDVIKISLQQVTQIAYATMELGLLPKKKFIIFSNMKVGQKGLLDEQKFTLASIYAPNQNQFHFFEEVMVKLESFSDGEIIIGGYFNSVADMIAGTTQRSLHTMDEASGGALQLADLATQLQQLTQLLAQDLAWNEAALMDQYAEGLADEILDELAWVDRPNTLQNLITLCLRIDGRLERRC
ncbi:UNVERIFIED_CONTAM: hypothetical protein K2H54_000964 [Gekko kuhli]